MKLISKTEHQHETEEVYSGSSGCVVLVHNLELDPELCNTYSVSVSPETHLTDKGWNWCDFYLTPDFCYSNKEDALNKVTELLN